MSPKYLLQQANCIADKVVAAMTERGLYIEMPLIDMRWCRRWRRDHGVVLLQPNRRYKVAWPLMVTRLLFMWMNNFRVRYMAQKFLGKDLADRIFGIDEKPIHFNESGSKAVKTLHYEGAPYCALRTNHSASRDRMSLMTMVSSWRELCLCPKGLPVALCVRAESAQKLAGIKLPERFRISLDWSLSGSYNEPRFFAYLDTWLEPWTDARAAADEYRLLYFDVAASHLGDHVEEFCWKRGYICLIHYGGTTSVGQVNDTHCHGQVSDVYVELEQSFFTARQANDPGNINRSLAEVVADVVTTWRTIDHERVCDGHWATGLANKLDATEDGKIEGEAREVWDYLVEKGLLSRERAFAEVDKMIADGAVTGFHDVRKVIRHPPTTGEYKRGEEFEGELRKNEKAWETPEDIALFKADDQDEFADPATCTTALVEFVAGDDVVEWSEGNRVAKKRAQLLRLLAESKALALPAAVFTIRRDIVNLERGKLTKNTTESKLNAVFSRSLRLEAAVAKKKQEANGKKARTARRIKKVLQMAANKKKKAKLLLKLDKEMREELMMGYQRKITSDMCGTKKNFKGYTARKNRENLLERLRLRSPPLPYDLEDSWPRFKRTWCKIAEERYGLLPAGLGHTFVAEVNDCLEALKCYYNGKTEFNKGSRKEGLFLVWDKMEGDPMAFENYVRRTWEKLPKSTVSVCI